MVSEIVVGVREDDGDELLVLMGMEDQMLLWDNINPPPPLPPLEDDLGLCLDVESSFTLLPLPPNSSHPSVASLSIEQIEQFLLNDDHDHHRTYSHDPSDDCLIPAVGFPALVAWSARPGYIAHRDGRGAKSRKTGSKRGRK